MILIINYILTKNKIPILLKIEKLNWVEEAIGALIIDFEDKVDGLFDDIKSDKKCKRLIAKILDDGTSFSQEEIYSDLSDYLKNISM